MLPGGVAGLSRHSSLLTTREVCFPRQVSTEKAPGRPGACGRNLSPGQEAFQLFQEGAPTPLGGGRSDELGVLKWVLYTPGDGQKPVETLQRAWPRPVPHQTTSGHLPSEFSIPRVIRPLLPTHSRARVLLSEDMAI